MKTRFVALGVVIICLVLAGCIEYEEQTVTFRHDRASDTLYIFQDYRGIFGGNEAGSLTEQETEQLQSVMKGGRTFFFNNWITEYSRTEMEKLSKTPPGEIDDDPASEAAVRAFAELALRTITVENVGFYFDAKQRLCGAQKVTVTEVSKVVPALNRVLAVVLRTQAMENDRDEEESRLLLRFVERGETVVRLNGNHLDLRWPLPRSEFEKVESSRQANAFRAEGGTLVHSNGMIVAVLGETNAGLTSITLPFSESPYVANAVGAAKQYGIQESFDSAPAARLFVAPRAGDER